MTAGVVPKESVSQVMTIATTESATRPKFPEHLVHHLLDAVMHLSFLLFFYPFLIKLIVTEHAS